MLLGVCVAAVTARAASAQPPSGASEQRSAGPTLPEPARARAALKDAKGQEVGKATLEEMPGGIRLHLEVSKLPPGVHACHIHNTGSCEPPDFKSAGPHFNPLGKKHGMQNPEGAHAGDLPNLYVGPDGTGLLDCLAANVTLVGTGPSSLFHEGGASLVIHAGPDDNKTDPAGNAGDRIACGAVTR